MAAPLGVVDRMTATDLGAVGPPPAEPGRPGSIRPGPEDPDAGGGATRPLVPAGTHAEAFLLRCGDGLRLYEADEVHVEPVETVDASRHCGLVTPRAAGRLVTDDPEAVAAAFDRGVLGTAAELLGLSRAMLDMTVEYTRQRHQFGRPVGSFQAVKHHLADARIRIEFASPAVLHAAYAVAHRQPDASRSVSQAKWLAGAAAAVTGRAAQQCHGAVGYTTEHDLHLYLKRSWALARSWGSADFHADRVAASIGI